MVLVDNESSVYDSSPGVVRIECRLRFMRRIIKLYFDKLTEPDHSLYRVNKLHNQSFNRSNPLILDMKLSALFSNFRHVFNSAMTTVVPTKFLLSIA